MNVQLHKVRFTDTIDISVSSSESDLVPWNYVYISMVTLVFYQKCIYITRWGWNSKGNKANAIIFPLKLQ